MERDPGLDLILACARWAGDDTALPIVADCAAHITDWVRFHRLAQTHSMAALACAALQAAAVPGHPLLTAALRENQKRVLVLSSELARISRLLESTGVSPLAFKGPALAYSVYRDPGHRAFQDLDLLVAPGELGAAVECLRQDGYLETGDARMISARRTMLRWRCETSLVHRERRIWVDLHWSVLPVFFPARMPHAELAAQSVPVDIEGTAVRTLHPNDHLIYVCAHAAKHGWSHLGALADIAALLRHQVPDRESAIQRARRFGAGRMLDLGLALAAALPDSTRIPGPSPDLKLLRELSPGYRRWAGYALSRILAPTETDWEKMPLSCIASPWRQSVWRLLRICRTALPL